MTITPRNILSHELIGLTVKVVKSTYSGYVGIEGLVIDETMKTIRIMSNEGKIKVIPKDCCIFRFKLPTGIIVEVEGNHLVGRPEDRAKRVIKKRW